MTSTSIVSSFRLLSIQQSLFALFADNIVFVALPCDVLLFLINSPLIQHPV